MAKGCFSFKADNDGAALFTWEVIQHLTEEESKMRKKQQLEAKIIYLRPEIDNC